MNRTLHRELVALVEEGTVGVRPKDQEIFPVIVAGLRLWLARWYPMPSGTVKIDLPQAAGRTAASQADVLRIARLYPAQIAAELGASSGTYNKSEYHPSGRGAFGRLGGSGKRGVKSDPTLTLKF